MNANQQVTKTIFYVDSETPTTTENLNLFWRLKWLRHNERYARARAIECGVIGLVVETIL